MSSNNDLRKLLLENIYRLSNGQVNSLVQTPNLVQACKNNYINIDDIYSDISYFEDKGFITSIKADNAPVLAVKITSKGVDEIDNSKISEEQWKNELDILSKLTYLYNEKDRLIGGDISGEQGRQWLANISALIGKVNVSKQEDFDILSHKVILPLSNITRVPIWESLLLIIQQIIAGIESTKDENPEKVYPAGSSYDFYRDVKQIMQSSKTSIMIVDPYADEELLDLYVAKLNPNIELRLLIKQPLSAFKKVLEKFSKQYGPNFKCSYSVEIHDRVIIIDQIESYVFGQSIKDAANKKSTYRTKIYSKDIMKQYEVIWNRGTNIC
ncbi:MAG: hypothetical protein JXB17_04795 [Bacteroidales bacterium]|nr:hypothetical protein [Bacteroidales bacterium]